MADANQKTAAQAIYIALTTVALLTIPTQAEQTITAADLNDKVRGMWIGQLIGNAAGRSTEGKYSGSYPNPDPSVPWVIKQEWDADDDTDIEYIALHILETNGFDCNNADLAAQWQEHITLGGIYIANRQAWYLMGDGYLPPDTGSRTYNKHWYSIDSQITTEVLGAASPSLVQQAIDLTGKFAHITNEGFPVHAAQYYAALYANAFFESDVETLITQALDTIPTTSRTHQVISDVITWYTDDANDGSLDWRATRRKLYDKYQGADSFGRYYMWIESTVNTGATVLSILYGQGDFKETVQIGVLAGWDCDCNPATSGGLIGIITGFRGLPTDLTDPAICGDTYKNVYRPYLPDPNQPLPQYEAITNIAARITALAEQNILAAGGYITSSPEKAYHILDSAPVVPDPEKPDPAGPAGLVGDALAAGIAVTTSAAVENHDPNDDRKNLDAIIDGITDNTYNGHKAYWSRYAPASDWYQLDFSKPVRFQGVKFYEGDIVWKGINEYSRDDDITGRYFEDLTVEILRDGKFIEPGNLSMSPPLDPYEMYQAINFTFSPTVGQAIRVIGTVGGTVRFTTIMELEADGQLDPGLYVRSTRICEGHIQRSTVDTVTVTFNRDITIAPGAVTLTGASTGTIAEGEHMAVAYEAATRRLQLRFDMDGDNEFADSLPDDMYALVLSCQDITDANGLPLLDDDTAPGDGNYTVMFHRLFGDTDGSATVNALDLNAMSATWLAGPAKSGLDVDGNNRVNMRDYAALAANWHKWN